MDAVKFFRQTGVDALAISYGTKHGANKGKDTVIRKEIAIATKECMLHEGIEGTLVSHGSSTVPQYIVSEINALGGEIHDALSLIHISLVIFDGMCYTEPTAAEGRDGLHRVIGRPFGPGGGDRQPQQQKAQQRRAAAHPQQKRGEIRSPVRQGSHREDHGSTDIKGEKPSPPRPESEGGQPVKGQRQKDQGQQLHIVSRQDGVHGVHPCLLYTSRWV